MQTSHLNALRALEATLRTGSFTAAATELGVTPAAVGQQVRTLEAFLGTRLLRRTKRGVVPTEAARRVELTLTASLSGLADVLARLRDSRSERRVAVTLPASFAENWLTHRISAFYREHESVDLRLDATNRMVDLVAEDFDFALRYSRPGGPGFDDVVLFGDHVLPVCAPTFAERYRLSPDIKSLEDVPLVHLGVRTPDPDWADWETWGSAFGFAPGPLGKGVRYSQLNSGLQAALSGQGLVLCGVTEAFAAISQGLLVVPFGPDMRCPAGYKYRLVSVRGRQLSELQRSFRDWVLEASIDFARTVLDRLGIPLR